MFLGALRSWGIGMYFTLRFVLCVPKSQMLVIFSLPDIFPSLGEYGGRYQLIAFDYNKPIICP